MHGVGDSREEVGGITGLRQALPPVDHEPGQGLQEVILHLDRSTSLSWPTRPPPPAPPGLTVPRRDSRSQVKACSWRR